MAQLHHVAARHQRFADVRPDGDEQLVEGSGRVPSMFPRTVKETRNTNSNPGLSRIFLRYQWGRLGGHPWRDC